MRTKKPIHPDPHPMAGKTVVFSRDGCSQNIIVEDWWDRVAGYSWFDSMVEHGTPAILEYARHFCSRGVSLPLDNNVIYGKVRSGLGMIVHDSEIVP